MLTNYFPMQDRSVKEYQLLYGRMIVDCLSCEEGSTDPSGLSFGVVVHCARVEMIEYGRYYSVVSAELVGSQDRIWALVIRFYDMAALAYRVTVLMNPYDGFLKNLVGAKHQEQGLAMRNLLVGESVRETVLWLKRTNQLGTRLSLVEYLQLHGLI